MTRRIIFVTGGAGVHRAPTSSPGWPQDPSLDLVVCDRLGEAQLGKWRNLVKHPIGDFVAPEDIWDWLEKALARSRGGHPHGRDLLHHRRPTPTR